MAEDENAVFKMMEMMRALKGEEEEDAPPPPPIVSSFDAAGIAAAIKGGAKNIIFMTGAGVSVSAGIPDFRSPGTGLYSQLEEYELPDPQSIFEIGFFKEKPAPFYLLAKNLYPGLYRPTPAHYFQRLLCEKGLVKRIYTQNIDSLEAVAGIDPSLVVAAHGNFDGATVVTGENAGKTVDTAEVKDAILAGPEGTDALTEKYGGLVKPDIVFFGESLPARFHSLVPGDFKACDLLIVMGTSLVVHPFASLINLVSDETPRCLINREEAGTLPLAVRKMYKRAREPVGFEFDEETRYRDVALLGDCDDGVRALAAELGWADELEALIAKGGAEFEAAGGSAGGGAIVAAAAAAAATDGADNVPPLSSGGSSLVQEIADACKHP